MGRSLPSGRTSSVASGSSILTLWAISGAVIMKMISSTSITSTRGVTLISAIGPPPPLLLLKAIVGLRRQRRASALGRDGRFADARAGGEEVVQVVREGVEAGVRVAVHAYEEVVREHRRDGDEQTERGHDQRLADRAGDGVDRRLAGSTDADQRAVDAPHGTEQADERGGRAHGREPGQAVLELGALARHRLAQGAVDELGAVQGFHQAAAFVARVMVRGLRSVERDLRERLT